MNNFGTAPKQYDPAGEQAFRNQVRAADSENFKKGQDLRLQRGERLILMSPNGTLYYLTVSNAGVLGTATV